MSAQLYITWQLIRWGVAVTRTRVLIRDIVIFLASTLLSHSGRYAIYAMAISIQFIIGLDNNYNYKAMLLQHCTSKVSIKHGCHL